MEKFNDKISQKWEEAKKFITDPETKEKTQEVYEKVKKETIQWIDVAKDKINEVKEDDRVKDFLNSASETIDDTIQTIHDSEVYNKVKENISTTIDTIKNDEKIQIGVKKAKSATLNFAKKALSSIEKMLDDTCENDVVVHEIYEDHNNE